MLHSNTNKTLYHPLPINNMPEYSMPCQRKSKRQKQNKRIGHNSILQYTTSSGKGATEEREHEIYYLVFSLRYIFLLLIHVLPFCRSAISLLFSSAADTDALSCPQFILFISIYSPTLVPLGIVFYY